jgi:hypothetical protein
MSTPVENQTGQPPIIIGLREVGPKISRKMTKYGLDRIVFAVGVMKANGMTTTAIVSFVLKTITVLSFVSEDERALISHHALAALISPTPALFTRHFQELSELLTGFEAQNEFIRAQLVLDGLLLRQLMAMLVNTSSEPVREADRFLESTIERVRSLNDMLEPAGNVLFILLINYGAEPLCRFKRSLETANGTPMTLPVFYDCLRSTRIPEDVRVA